MFLTFQHKREIFRSYPELKEEIISNGRVNYRYEASRWPKKTVARELSYTGNGYIYGAYLVEYKDQVDDRGWISIRDYNEKPLRELIRKAIISFGGKGLEQTTSVPAATKTGETTSLSTGSFIGKPNEATMKTMKIQQPTLVEKSLYSAPFKEFLKQHGFLPIDQCTWNRFEIIHGQPKSTVERNKINDYIAEKVKDANGIYVYTNVAGEIIYIGKAKPLKNRLQSHYRESFEEVPGDTKDKRWHRFFSAHEGKLIVFWREVKDEGARAIIEKMLTYVCSPVFEGRRQGLFESEIDRNIVLTKASLTPCLTNQ